MQAAVPTPRLVWPPRPDRGRERLTPEEVPVAIVHDGATHAVMMASPTDLEDFAVGFSFTEGVIAAPSELRDMEVVRHTDGIEVRSWLAPGLGAALARRRRRLAGPTGCGLCGVESLEAANVALDVVAGEAVLRPDELMRAMAALGAAQPLGRRTRAVHAAGFWRDGELVAVREDVGRHNALDKLVGGLLRGGVRPNGVLLLTSRVSVEMVQKAARFGAPILCAVSAPTALAVRTAEAARITLVAVCRADGFEVFTHSRRIVMDVPEAQDAAHARLFDFEDDFVRTLRCIPMCVRFKLDRTGIKLSLRQWSRFTQSDREALRLAPCETQAEVDEYRRRLIQLVSERSGDAANDLAEAPPTSWADPAPPPTVVGMARDRGGIEVSAAAWRSLDDLQRYALVKLTRDKHENANFAPALAEFGVARALAEA